MLFGQLLNCHIIFKRVAKALIRLRVCAGWSEPLLVAHTTLLEISCHGSNEGTSRTTNIQTTSGCHMGENLNFQSPELFKIKS